MFSVKYGTQNIYILFTNTFKSWYAGIFCTDLYKVIPLYIADNIRIICIMYTDL